MHMFVLRREGGGVAFMTSLQKKICFVTKSLQVHDNISSGKFYKLTILAHTIN